MYENGFVCDAPLKKQLRERIMDEWFSAYTVTFGWECFDDNAKMDIVFTATSKSNREYKYAIEVKERKGYTAEQLEKDGYMLEEKKYNTLCDYATSGYSSYYFNSFKDGKFYLWKNDDKMRNSRRGKVKANKYTQKESEEVWKDCLLLDNKDIVFSGYCG